MGIFLTDCLKIFMHKYPSDINRSQFTIIVPILESSCKTTSPRIVDLYDFSVEFHIL